MSLALTLLLACSPKAVGPVPAAQPPSSRVIHIAAINDFHGSLYETRHGKTDDAPFIGGLPVLAGAIDHLRTAQPDLLLLDGGDLFQGPWAINQSFGMGSVQSYNLLGVDAAAVGNHEFDYGQGGRSEAHPKRGALEAGAKAATYQWLSANIYTNEGTAWSPEGIKPWTVIERSGVKIGLIGVTTMDTPQTTLLSNVDDLHFRDPVQVVKDALPQMRAAGAEVIILLGHLTGKCAPTGFTDPQADCVPDGEIGRLLTELPEGSLDVMILGHAHTMLNQRIGQTYVIESRAKSKVIGQLDLVVGPSGVDHEATVLHPPWALIHEPIEPGCEGGAYKTTPLNVGGVSIQPNVKAIELIDALEEKAGSLCEVVACNHAHLSRSRDHETAIGDVVADIMRDAFEGADFAVQNSGGIRADLPKGPIRLEHLQAVMPFENRLLMVELSGEQVARLFQIGSSGAHGILQVSGASYHFDPKRTEQTDLNGDGTLEKWETDRVCSVSAGGQPIDPARRYKVVTTDFLLGGGDHLGPVFQGAKVLKEGPLLRDAIFQWFKASEECLGESAPLLHPDAPRVTIGACAAP